MIIDFHVHAFPRRIRNKREAYFKGEPEFELLYKPLKHKLVGASEIIKDMNNNKVSISVIFGFPWHNYDFCRLNNNYIIEMVHKYPNRLKGFCCVDPFHPMASNEVERCLKLGLSGVGELAFYANGITEECLVAITPIMDICKEYKVPVMLHTNEEIGHFYPGKTCNTIGQIYEFVKRFSSNKLVLAHWGGGLFFFNILKKEVPEVLSNTYYDISASPFLYNKNIYSIAKKLIGVEKFIFGTDYPLLQPRRYLNEMLDSGLNESDIRKVCFGNASKLLNL